MKVLFLAATLGMVVLTAWLAPLLLKGRGGWLALLGFTLMYLYLFFTIHW